MACSLLFFSDKSIQVILQNDRLTLNKVSYAVFNKIAYNKGKSYSEGEKLMGIQFEAIHCMTTPSIIVSRILQALETGELKPGQKLPPERELGKMFGVGRSSVREAVKTLAVMGNLQVIQGKGIFVCEGLNAKNSAFLLEGALQKCAYSNLLAVRKALDFLVLQAETKRTQRNFTEYLQSIVSVMEASQEDLNRLLKADMDFHYALADHTDNILAGEMIRVLSRAVFRRRNDCYDMENNKTEIICSAQQIMRMLRSIYDVTNVSGAGIPKDG